MRISRRDGILIVECKKSFKVAYDGKMVERNRVICKEITFEAEAAAFDLEQSVRVALMNISTPQDKKYSSQEHNTANDENDEKMKKFFENDCPSIKEVEEQGAMIEMMCSMNKQIRMSEIVNIFGELLHHGLIEIEGNIKMTPEIWKTVDRKDKLKIMFNYIAFFANPLQSLLTTSASLLTDHTSMQGESKK